MSPPTRRDAVDRRAWSARFGWLVGGIVGALAGFVATRLLDVHVYRAHALHPEHAAELTVRVLVPALFLAGALTGHAFGARGGAARYRALGLAAGFCVALCLWALLVVTRG